MPSGYASALVQSIVALAGVCAFAVVLLRFAAGRGFGRAPKGKRLELIERLPLDARSAVCVVRAGDKAWLIGTSDASAPTLLAELPASEPIVSGDALEAAKPGFRELLAPKSDV